MTKQPHVTRLKTETTFNRDDYETPQLLFDLLDETFRFTLDAAASRDNSKCKDCYTIKEDALRLCWGQYLEIGLQAESIKAVENSIFCNPPFSSKEKFLQAGLAYRNKNKVIVFILPNNARSTVWWHTYVQHADLIINLSPRVNYCIDGEEQKGVAFDSCAVVFYPRIDHEGIQYEWPKDIYWYWKGRK